MRGFIPALLILGVAGGAMAGPLLTTQPLDRLTATRFEFEYPAGRPLYIELETRLGDRFRVPGISFPGGGRVDMIISSTLRNSGFVRRAP